MKNLAKSFLIAAIVIGVLMCFLVPAIRRAREAAHESACRGRMCKLQLALRNYQEANGHLPPAFVRGPNGEPWHSWRVLLLPYLEFNDVYERYRFDEPWNGPNNRLLADQVSAEWFQCHSGRDLGRTQFTNYVAVVGAGTAFPGDTSASIEEFGDGAENTVLLVEITGGDIHWMEPRDLPFDSMTWESAGRDEPVLSNIHGIGAGVAFADHIRCYRAPRELRPETLRALLTTSGGEGVTRDALTGGDVEKILSEK